MLKKNNKYKETIIMGVILITVGITLLFNNYVKTKRTEVFNKMNLMLLDTSVEEINEEETEPEDNEIEEPVEEIKEETSTSYDFEPYLAVLKIPKIGLERGFYDKNSSLNNVDYNIMFHANSNYPNEEKGNVILASHSGSSSISYFKKLYLLDKGDLAYVNYKNSEYTYKVVNIYYEEKDGKIAIYRDENKNTLTLITCTKNDNSKQTVYILEQI